MSKKDQKKSESHIEEIDLSSLSIDGLFDIGKIREISKEKKGDVG